MESRHDDWLTLKNAFNYKEIEEEKKMPCLDVALR